MPRTTHELLDIASNHTDGEEAVAATLNTPQGKGKQVVDYGEGTSSRFKKKKKKKKNDKRRRDDNFVAVVNARFHAPRETRAIPHQPRITSRSSWMHRAHTTRSPSSTRLGGAGS
jgi:hypothetical protein